jgi:hypothetical protein
MKVQRGRNFWVSNSQDSDTGFWVCLCSEGHSPWGITARGGGRAEWLGLKSQHLASSSAPASSSEMVAKALNTSRTKFSYMNISNN